MTRSKLRTAGFALATVVATFLLTVVGPGTGTTASGATGTSVSHAGTWMTNPAGQVLIVHGLNQVYKVPPYEPAADGFSDDDAAFLAANGFNAVRVGVIWAGVEPQPGVYNQAYIASIEQTVQTLAAHGIASLLDFHQDLYNEQFSGEGAPAWAVQTGGLPNANLGFPWNYFGNLALDHALDAFWSNAPGPGGVGLQDRYAGAWAAVAKAFAGNPSVLGYELFNEPFPGTLWEACLVPLVGCALFEGQLTAFYNRVDKAIRSVDPSTTVWFEPSVLFNEGLPTDLGTVADPHTGFAFHDYCAFETVLSNAALCPPEDDLVFGNAAAYAKSHGIPDLMTEFGATDDLGNLTEVANIADTNMVGWLEWAYTGNDKTSSSPNGQSLVLNPELPPTGSNVVTAKLAALARPYPQLTSGTPTGWNYNTATNVFTFTYSTSRADGTGQWPAGSTTQVATPAIQYPNGYAVVVAGATVTSAPGSPQLTLASCAGSAKVTVIVKPGSGVTSTC